MSQTRKQIRKEVVDLLRKKKLDRIDDKVYGNRSIPDQSNMLPVINVYPRSEDLEEWTQAPRQHIRSLQLVVEIKADESTDEKTSDFLDDTADMVERHITADDTLDGNVEDIELSSVEFEYQGEGEQLAGSCRLVFIAKYIRGAPETRADQRTDDFKTVGVDWDLPDTGEDVDTQDEITLPTT